MPSMIKQTDAIEERLCGKALVHIAPSSAVKAAGRPTAMSAEDFDGAACTPCDVIGGISRLQDRATAGPGQRLFHPSGRTTGNFCEGDANRGVRGGWIPAEPGAIDRHWIGFREGSRMWRKQFDATVGNVSKVRLACAYPIDIVALSGSLLLTCIVCEWACLKCFRHTCRWNMSESERKDSSANVLRSRSLKRWAP